MHPRPIAFAVAAIAVLGLAGCDSGSSAATPKPRRTTTTTIRKHSGSTTTTTKAPSSTSSSTGPVGSSTTVAPSPSTSTWSSAGDCGPRADAIYGAVQGGDLGPVPLAQYTLTNCRVSATNPIWSAITLAPRAGAGVPQLTVALERIGATWMVRQYGPDHVACDAPPPVPTELQLGC